MWSFKFERGFFVYLLLAVLIAIVFFKFFVSEKTTAKEFIGNISKIEESSIFAEGVFISEQAPGSSPKYGRQTVEILITQNSKIIRVGLKLPSQEELEKTKGLFMVDDLEKEEKTVDFETLKKDYRESVHIIGIRIKAKDDIFSSKKIVAEEIVYTLPVSP